MKSSLKLVFFPLALAVATDGAVAAGERCLYLLITELDGETRRVVEALGGGGGVLLRSRTELVGSLSAAIGASTTDLIESAGELPSRSSFKSSFACRLVSLLRREGAMLMYEPRLALARAFVLDSKEAQK